MIELNRAPFEIKKIYNIYEYFDEPLVYTFIDKARRLFLITWVDWNDGKYTWLVKEISYQVAIQLERKEITLREVYVNSDIPNIYILEEFSNGDKKFFLSFVDQLEESILPEKDSYIEFSNENILGSVELIETATRHSNRYIVDLSLEPNNGHSNEISASVLGESLVTFQSLVQTIALGNEATVRTRIDDNTKDENELLVTETFAASFGVRMESNKFVTLLQEDPVKESIGKTIELLSAASNLSLQKEILSKNNLKSLKSLMSLLSTLSENKVGMKVKSAFPTATDEMIIHEVHLTSEESTSLLNNMENTKEIKNSEATLNGTLYSFDAKSKAFKFITEDSTIYRGYVTEEVENNSFNIPSKGEIKLSIVETNFVYTGNIKYEYQLLSWQ